MPPPPERRAPRKTTAPRGAGRAARPGLLPDARASTVSAPRLSPGAVRTASGGAVVPDDERRALIGAADALGLLLDARQLDLLLQYLTLLRKWNAVYNLTAIRDTSAMLVQHLFDCLAIVPALRTAHVDGARASVVPEIGSLDTRSGVVTDPGPTAPSVDLLADGAVILDVGSGGGLPGVVLAICAPGAKVYCVDTVGKKAAFLTQVRAELGLTNLHAIHARVESLQAPRDLPAPSLIVSRAFSSLELFVSLTRHLLAPGGRWAAMKGAFPEQELDALPPPVRLSSAITLEVPRLDARRHLLLLAG